MQESENALMDDLRQTSLKKNSNSKRDNDIKKNIKDKESMLSKL